MIQEMTLGEALDHGYWHADEHELEPLDPRIGDGDVILREHEEWLVIRASDDSVRIVSPAHWSEGAYGRYRGLELDDYLGVPTLWAGDGDPFRSECSKDPHMNGVRPYAANYGEIPVEVATAFWQAVRLEREGFTRANWDRAVAEWNRACVWGGFPLERLG